MVAKKLVKVRGKNLGKFLATWSFAIASSVTCSVKFREILKQCSSPTKPLRSFQLPLPHHWHHSSSPSTSLTSFKLPLVHHRYHEKASTFQLHAPPHNHWHHSRPPVFCGTVHDFGLPLLFVRKSVSIYSGKLLTSEECPLSEDLRLPWSCSSVSSGMVLTSEECPLSEDLRLPSSPSLSLVA